MPKVLITGISGQDGAYLAKFLLDNGYAVWGTMQEGKAAALGSLAALRLQERVQLLPVDFTDVGSLRRVIETAAPDEIYNLAAQSSVAESFKSPLQTGEITGLGVARLLQAMREVKPDARFFQASSSEMYGLIQETPQTEQTPFRPRNPYAVAKVYAHGMTVTYREAYHCHASCGILFNHESPLRPERFVTRKITAAVARIKHGLQSSLALGNLDVERDWGFAGDYVEAMWRMLQQDEPDDYVIATGHIHSLREFVDLAFQAVGLNYHDHVFVDPAFIRPTETYAMVGCVDKAAARLGWRAQVTFQQLVELLVEADIRRVLKDESNIRYTME